jgi:hypothetical protein
MSTLSFSYACMMTYLKAEMLACVHAVFARNADGILDDNNRYSSSLIKGLYCMHCRHAILARDTDDILVAVLQLSIRTYIACRHAILARDADDIFM